jgi:hypothetical protein
VEVGVGAGIAGAPGYGFAVLLEVLAVVLAWVLAGLFELAEVSVDAVVLGATAVAS